MNTNKTLILAATAVTILAGAALAQSGRPFGVANPGATIAAFAESGRGLRFVATMLDLTDAQKADAKALFEKARADAQPIVERLKSGHEAMRTAVKENRSDAEIDAISARQSSAGGEAIAIYAKAFRDFYQTLTPDQRKKADELSNQFRERMQSRFASR